MGLLVDGEWQDKWYDTKSTGGKFVRQESRFRNWVTADGSKGPTGEGGFEAEAGRYHLYVALACPWAHRTLIFRKLKKLESAVSVSIVEPLMLEDGWIFSEADPVNGATKLWQVYTAADPDYSGRVTVPVLWDKKRKTIVSNESADIIRMFNAAFNGLDAVDATLDFYPERQRQAIDAINETVYGKINNGVYKTGFATTQDAYESAFTNLFNALDDIDSRLGGQRYLVDNHLTEADWRLFTTLVRFDAVYVGHFKCNLRRIQDYPNLSNYLRELYQVPGVAETVNMEHIKRHYYGSHATINPTGIVPLGPELDFLAPHDRAKLAA
ncbi:glutathione S-transferase family protein [Breoghania sp. L-A4]|uniref:glutathione S-transferase family protein n=1 Tax=Breoghania sp. L-A4 TaxID=2304600 RepID=UPI000E35EF3F|nr:glutathione S-transferase family protein [Breoghania sp. L-A4]AXS41471.1 glutathione S-transferase family protein [Breoghania sp. L-A4]